MMTTISGDEHNDAEAISFRQLKLFDSIGRLHSVRKASEECNLSQPAVTQALAKLERRVGAILVERRASGSYMNEAGETFLRRTRRFFDQTEQALIELGVAGGNAGARTVANRLSRSQIRSLIAIVDHMNFAEAAAKLGLSPASLQRAARDLEGNVRRPLFHRSAAGMMVGPHGSEFGRRMKLALQEVEWGLLEIEAMRGACSSQLSIGGMPFGGSMLLASALNEFLRAAPQVNVRVTIENAPSMQRSLRCGDVDLVVGLLAGSPDQGVVSEAFSTTPFSIVGRMHHPLLSKDRATLDDLASFDWVIGATGSSRRTCFDRLFAGRSLPHAPIETCALAGLHHLLAGSDRLTLLTSYEFDLDPGGLAQIPFAGIDVVPMIGVSMRAGWLPTRMHSDFIDIVRRKALTRRPALRKAS